MPGKPPGRAQSFKIQDRAKIYALIAEKNNGNDSPTEIPTIALCTEITTAIKAMK